MSSGLFTNDEGRVSGAKIILLIPCLLAVVWLGRDLWQGRELTEVHAILFGILLLVGLFNRVSGRGQIRISFGRDGFSYEESNRVRDH